MSGRSMEALVVGKVIGDVLDMFTPAAEFMVHYGSKQVANGCDIKPSPTADRPRVQIKHHAPSPANLYTLVMVDPDAPNPSEPTLREWLHWMVIDIPGGSDATKGKELVAYVGPQPPTGIHRYVFAIFRQNGTMAGAGPVPKIRNNFNTRQFSADHGLGLPAAAVYFNSQKQPRNKKC